MYFTVSLLAAPVPGSGTFRQGRRNGCRDLDILPEKNFAASEERGPGYGFAPDYRYAR
jgi:hypothetical protein